MSIRGVGLGCWALRLLAMPAWLWAAAVPAATLWSDLGATLVHETGAGADILGGTVHRDDSASDILYFKFHVDPRSDVSTEEYSAAFQLCEGDTNRLAVGNSWSAWAYSAFETDVTGAYNKVFGDVDLRSAHPESSSPGVFLPYELPRRGLGRTIVFKVQFVPGGHDLVTVWLEPDLHPGATEQSQSESLTTRFSANASFDQIRLRHHGGGDGWTFSDMAIATTFADFVRPGGADSNERENATGAGVAEFTFRSWQREQGLPQNSVHALAQTRDGYLWVGSDEGITRFDGVRFESFGLREGLRASRVRILGPPAMGRCGSAPPAAAWRGGTTDAFRLSPSTKDSPAIRSPRWRKTDRDASGSAPKPVWPSSRTAAWRPRRPTAISGARLSASSTATTMESCGSALPASASSTPEATPSFDWPGRRSIPCWPTRIVYSRTTPAGSGSASVMITWSVARTRSGVATGIPRHLARPFVNTLVQQANGTVWAGSVSEGLFQFKGGTLATINAANGLSDNMVESLLVDQEGNLWVGTGAGLNRIRRRNLHAFAQDEGLGYGAVQGMAEVAPGLIWAGKPGDGLYRWDGRFFGRMAGLDLFGQPPGVIALLRARDSTCWVSGGLGLLHFTNTAALAPSSDPPALPGRNVSALAERTGRIALGGDSSGELWRLGLEGWVPADRGSPNPTPSPRSRQKRTAPYGSARKEAVCPGCEGRSLSRWIGARGCSATWFAPSISRPMRPCGSARLGAA